MQETHWNLTFSVLCQDHLAKLGLTYYCCWRFPTICTFLFTNSSDGSSYHSHKCAGSGVTVTEQNGCQLQGRDWCHQTNNKVPQVATSALISPQTFKETKSWIAKFQDGKCDCTTNDCLNNTLALFCCYVRVFKLKELIPPFSLHP